MLIQLEHKHMALREPNILSYNHDKHGYGMADKIREKFRNMNFKNLTQIIIK